ncbi:MAG TPA: macro domain-containing protein [Terriglobia bacterium]|nr:macro domain-containing protein [Terriglobia bacterium]
MMPTEIHITEGDITEMAVDAIVNAANSDLILGGGVAGAIRRKGGVRVSDACEQIGKIPVGEAAITVGGNLKATYVIHAASMILGWSTSAEALRACTRNTLLRAQEKGLKSIAFPAVGTGIAGFPVDQCARIMLGEVLAFVKSSTSLEHIHFVLFDNVALKVFQDMYQKLISPAGVE